MNIPTLSPIRDTILQYSSSPSKVPFRDDEDEPVDAETEFGEYDFYDSGGVGWLGFRGDGG